MSYDAHRDNFDFSIDAETLCVCGYYRSAHINGFASTNQPDGACPWRFAVDGPDEQVYADFEAADNCKHGQPKAHGHYCYECDAESDYDGDDEDRHQRDLELAADNA